MSNKIENKGYDLNNDMCFRITEELELKINTLGAKMYLNNATTGEYISGLFKYTQAPEYMSFDYADGFYMCHIDLLDSKIYIQYLNPKCKKKY